jgi:hypothetical protein
MSHKVIESTGSPSRTTSTLDLVSDLTASAETKAKIKEEVGEFLVEQILMTVNKAQSPVSGEGWPTLSKDYRKEKLEQGGSGKPDMELAGDMLDSMTFKSTREGIEIGFFDSEAWKADGHLKFSGEENNTPKRRFLPAEGQSFRPAIDKEIDRIISDHLLEDQELQAKDFEGVETERDLYRILRAALPGESKQAVRAAALRSATLTELLEDLDLIDLL